MFGQLQSVFHINAQIAQRAIDLDMAEVDVNGAEVPVALEMMEAFVRRNECDP